MIPARSVALLVAAGALALSAGFASHYLSRSAVDLGLLSDDSDLQGLFSTPLPVLGGTPVSLEKWRGKTLIVNFWATWCAPCREEIPDFVKLQNEFGAKGVQFVGIAADQADKVASFSNEFKINYPILIGNVGTALELARRMGNTTSVLPFTVIIDREGRVVHRHLGVLKPAKLRSLFSDLP